VEHPILDAESRRNAAFTSDSEQPRRASPWGDAPTSDNDSPRRAGLSIDELGELSNNQRKKSETGLLEQPPESKAKISHHMKNIITPDLSIEIYTAFLKSLPGWWPISNWKR